MGFFSWKTADKNESIANRHSIKECKTVYLLQPNQEPIEENSYEGYGVFGGIDAYYWLAKHNLKGEELANKSKEEIRNLGCDLAFDNPEKIINPLKFSFDKNTKYKDVGESKNCEYQGFFY